MSSTNINIMAIMEKILTRIDHLENKINQLETIVKKPVVYMPPICNDYSHIDLKEQCYY
jgi:hypothetical protein